MESKGEAKSFAKKHYLGFRFGIVAYLASMSALYRWASTSPERRPFLVLVDVMAYIIYAYMFLVLCRWLVFGFRRLTKIATRKKSITPEDKLRTKAQDPNTDPKDLFDFAARYPQEVLGNLALPLISLEDPVLYTKIINRAQVNDLKQKCEDLTDSQDYLFAADCAERVLYLFEAIAPGEKRLRRAIEFARLCSQPIWKNTAFFWENKRSYRIGFSYINGTATEKDVLKAGITHKTCDKLENLLNSIADQIEDQNERHDAAYQAALSVIEALLGNSIEAAHRALGALIALAKDEQEKSQIEEKERRWQIERVDRYLHQEPSAHR